MAGSEALHIIHTVIFCSAGEEILTHLFFVIPSSGIGAFSGFVVINYFTNIYEYIFYEAIIPLRFSRELPDQPV